MSSEAPSPLPKTVGGYVVERELGQGGMGRVYLGRHEGLDRLVALKVLQPKLANEQEFVDRFLREARAAAKFAHPNVVTVFDTGIDDNGVHFIAFEFVHGGTAEDLLKKEGKVDSATVIRIALGVAEALEFAESQGIVHRDVKPENILLTPDGVPKLADLGLAKQVENEQSNLTQTGMVLGTPLYMSPEQALGDPLDIRSDVYSLGLCMWRMLTGLIPFDEDRTASSLQIINRHINQDLADVRDREPRIDPGLAHVIGRMSAREVEDRYPNAHAVVSDLRRLHSGVPISGAHAVAPASSGRNTRVPSGRTTGLGFANTNPAHRSGYTAEHETPAQPRTSSGSQASTPTLAMDQIHRAPRKEGSNSLFLGLVALLLVGGSVGFAVYSTRNDRVDPTPAGPKTNPPPVQPDAPDPDELPEFGAEVGPRERIGLLGDKLRDSLNNLARARKIATALREQIGALYEDDAAPIDETEEVILGAFEQLLDALSNFEDTQPSVEDLFAGAVDRSARLQDDLAEVKERCKAVSQVIYGLDRESSRALERGLVLASQAYDRDRVEAVLARLPDARADALGALQRVALDIAVAHTLSGYARAHLLEKRTPPNPNWLTDPRPALRGAELFAVLNVSEQLRNPGLSTAELSRYQEIVNKAHLGMRASLLGFLTRAEVAAVVGFLQVPFEDNTPIAAAMAYEAALTGAKQAPLWLDTVRRLRDSKTATFVGGAVTLYLPKPPIGSQALKVRLSDSSGRVHETRTFEAYRYSIEGVGSKEIKAWPSPAWVTVRVHNGVVGVTVCETSSQRPTFTDAARLPKQLGAVEGISVRGAMPFKAYLVDSLALPRPGWREADIPEHPSDRPKPPEPQREPQHQTPQFHPSITGPDGRPVPVNDRGEPVGPDGKPLQKGPNGKYIFPPPPNGQHPQDGQRPQGGPGPGGPQGGGPPGGGRGGRPPRR